MHVCFLIEVCETLHCFVVGRSRLKKWKLLFSNELSFVFPEVLPLVQFYLEENISDEEAVSLTDLEVPHMDEGDAQQRDMDNGILSPQHKHK